MTVRFRNFQPRLAWMALLTCLALGLVACAGPAAQEPAEIRIGLLATLSGDAVNTGTYTTQAAELAVQQVNEAGGLEVGGQKYKVVLVPVDDKNNPEASVVAAQRLINQEEIVALVGPQFSRNAIAVSEAAERANIPMLSPMSTNPKTTAGKAFVFRVGFVDPFQGQVLARFAHSDLKAQKAAVLYDISNDYNRGVAEVFKQAFEAAGGEVVAFENYTADQKEDFQGQLEVIKASDPDVLFLPNYDPEVPRQVQQARALGIDAVLLGSDSWNPTLFAEQPEFEGAYISQHWHLNIENEKAQAFIQAYREAYDADPRITAAITYDAFGLLFQAMRDQGATTPKAIQQGLAGLHDFQGVSGSISYAQSGDPIKSVVILQIKDGQSHFYKVVNP